jgi:hypothetical protein
VALRRAAALAVAAVLLAGAPAVAPAQVFLASSPHPSFAIGPLIVVANVTPGLDPVSVTLVLSLVTLPDRPPAEIEQDLFVLWPAEIASEATGPADPLLARHLEMRGFTVTAAGQLAMGVRDRLKIGTVAPSDPAGVSATYASFVRRDAPQQGTGTYIRIPWTPKLVDPLAAVTLTLPLRGLVLPKPASWLEEMFWGRRWIVRVSVGELGPPSLPLFPLYFELRDRVVRLARDPSMLLANFSDSHQLRIEEFTPSNASRRMSRIRTGNEVVSMALTPSEGTVPQTLRVQFSYASGLGAWRPVLISAGILVLGNLAGLFMASTWCLDVWRRRRAARMPPLAAFAGLVPGETTYGEVVQRCGPPAEEYRSLPSGERRTLVYRGRRRMEPDGTGDGAAGKRAGIEEHEVEIPLEGDRVAEVRWRVRRARAAG